MQGWNRRVFCHSQVNKMDSLTAIVTGEGPVTKTNRSFMMFIIWCFGVLGGVLSMTKSTWMRLCCLVMLCGGVLTACQQRNCTGASTKEQPVVRTVSSCRQVRILGGTPSWGGACQSQRHCRIQATRRFRWTRCLGGLCLYGAEDVRRGHLHAVLTTALSADGRLATADAGGWIKIWDWKKGTVLMSWQAEPKKLQALAWVSKTKLLSGGILRRVSLWDISKGPRLLKSYKVGGRISSLLVSKRGDVVAASTDRSLWWGRLEQPKWSRLRAHEDAVRQLSLHPSQHYFLSASDDRTIGLWKMSEGTRAPSLLTRLRGPLAWVRDAHFLPAQNGFRIVSGGMEQSLSFWRVLPRDGDLWKVRRTAIWGKTVDVFGHARQKDKKVIQELTTIREGHRSDISALDVSLRGRFLFSAGHRLSISMLPDDGTVARVWSMRDKKLHCLLKGHLLGINDIRALDKRHVATASDDGTIRIFSIR